MPRSRLKSSARSAQEIDFDLDRCKARRVSESRSAVFVRPPVRRRQAVGRLPAAGVVLAAGMSGAALGSTTRKFLNTERVEQAIEHAALTERKMRIVVRCPSRVEQRKGVAFACPAVVGGGTTRFLVVRLDNADDAHYRAAS
jgi:hypothetical protein